MVASRPTPTASAVRPKAEQAQPLSHPLDLLALQSTLAEEAAASLIALSEQSLAAWLAWQSAWWRDLETLLAGALHPWQQASASASSAGALICPPEQPGTGTLLEAATQAWPMAAQVMLNALQHDLQDTAVKH